MRQRYGDRNADLLVNITGALVHRDEAGVSPFDAVVQGGDAVWEGLRVYDGRVFRLDEHLARLRSSAQALGAWGALQCPAKVRPSSRPCSDGCTA